MVGRHWRRVFLVTLGAFVLLLPLSLSGAFTQSSARAAALDQAALTDQKTLISTTLQKLAGDLKYQYEEDQAGQLGAYDVQSYGATANMDVRTPNGSGHDDAHILVIQFASPELAADYAARGRDEWPMGTDTTPIGNHQASISTDFNEHGAIAWANVGWVCGVQKNLIVLGRYAIDATDPSQSSVARSKLLALATTVHDAFVTAGVCEADYRLDVHPVMNKDGSNYEFPLRVTTQLQKRQPDGTWKNVDLSAPLYVEYSSTQGTDYSLVECLHPAVGEIPGSSLTGFTLAAQPPGDHLNFIRHDADEDRQPLFTNPQGKCDLNLLRFAWKGTIRKDNYSAQTTKYSPDYAMLGKLLYQLGQAWGKTGPFTGEGCSMAVTVYADPGWQERNKGHTGEQAVRDAGKDAEDFTVQATVQIKLNQIAQVVALQTHQWVDQAGSSQGKALVASVRHSWVSNASNKWEPLKVGSPFMPWDRVSLGMDDRIIIAWPDGTTYAFATNPKALYDPQLRVEFWVSPCWASDILDQANYHDDAVWQVVSLLQPSDPIIGLVVKAPVGEAQSWLLSIVKKAGGAFVRLSSRVTLGVLCLLAENQGAKPVIYQQVKSSVVMLMKDRPEEYLLDGELTTYDDQGNVVQTLNPGEMTRFGGSWLATDMTPPIKADPPAAAIAQVKDLETMMTALPGTSDTGTSGTDAGAGSGGTATSGGNGNSAGAGSQTTAPQDGSEQRNDVVVGSSLGWRFYLPIGVGAGCIVLALIVTLALAASRRRKATVAMPVGPQPPYAVPAPFAPQLPYAQPSPPTAPGWFISRGQESLGPYSWTQLVGFARISAVAPEDLVVRPQGSEWIRAADLPGLFAGLQPPPPPPPPPR